MAERERLEIIALSNRDHRTLFSERELEQALATFMTPDEAHKIAAELMEGPIVQGKPSFFTDDLLDLLSEISADVAERVRIARGP